jgi:hypothetical protein
MEECDALTRRGGGVDKFQTYDVDQGNGLVAVEVAVGSENPDHGHMTAYPHHLAVPHIETSSIGKMDAEGNKRLLHKQAYCGVLLRARRFPLQYERDLSRIYCIQLLDCERGIGEESEPQPQGNEKNHGKNHLHYVFYRRIERFARRGTGINTATFA